MTGEVTLQGSVQDKWAKRLAEDLGVTQTLPKPHSRQKLKEYRSGCEDIGAAIDEATLESLR